MKKIIFLITSVFFGLVSCKSKYHLNKNELFQLNSEIDKMAENDQKDRLALFDIDLIYNQEQFTYMKSKSMKMDLLGTKYDEYQFKIDSLWTEINKNDEINTIRLIEITSRYGFPNNRRLKVYKAKACFIFVHSPKNYFEQINEIVEKEYSEYRMTEYEKEYIYWHTKYERNGMPPMCGENGEAIKNTN